MTKMRMTRRGDLLLALLVALLIAAQSIREETAALAIARPMPTPTYPYRPTPTSVRPTPTSALRPRQRLPLVIRGNTPPQGYP